MGHTAEKDLPADWHERHRVYPPDHPPAPGVTYRCVRCDRESVGAYPRGTCVIPPDKG